MPNFSALIPEIHPSVSPGFIDRLIQTQRSELFTGLMQFCQPSNENLVLAFVGGVESKLYRYRQNTTEMIPRSDWPKTLFSSDASVGLLPLSLEAMRVVQVAHEAPVVRLEQMNLDPLELLDFAERWALDPEPSVVQVHTEQADHFYLCADRSNRVFEGIVLVAGKVQFSMSDPSFAQKLSQGPHQVTRYISLRDHEVWRGYELRMAFVPLMRMLMQRFSELAGRSLTERLGEQLSAWARGGGWNMTFSSNGVINRQYFDSLDEAANAYLDLLRRFQLETESAIGSRMVENISREVLFRLDASLRELLMHYLFNYYGIGGVVVRDELGDPRL
jgi:hypothetical protein